MFLSLVSSKSRITEAQNCRGWKGFLEIIESNRSAKASSLQIFILFFYSFFQVCTLPEGEKILFWKKSKVSLSFAFFPLTI